MATFKQFETRTKEIWVFKEKTSRRGTISEQSNEIFNSFSAFFSVDEICIEMKTYDSPLAKLW